MTRLVQAEEGSGSQAVDGKPIYIALVDLTCSLDFLELVKSGLLAALEAVPSASLFGLVTFSHKVEDAIQPVGLNQSCSWMQGIMPVLQVQAVMEGAWKHNLLHMPVTASVPLQLCVTAPRVGGDFTKPNTKTDQQVLHFASTAPSSQPIAYTLAPLEVSCYQTLPLEHALHADWAV